MKYLKYIFLVFYIFITLVIFIKALENGETSTTSSNQVTDVIVDAIDNILPGEKSITDKFDIDDIKFFIRKAIGHFGIFLILGIFSTLTYFYFINKKNLSIIITIIVGVITAALSELFQAIPDGRSPAFTDILIDCGGYFLAVVSTWLIIYVSYYIKLKRSSK